MNHDWTKFPDNYKRGIPEYFTCWHCGKRWYSDQPKPTFKCEEKK